MKASPLDLQGKGATTIIHHHHHLHHHLQQQQQQQPLDPFSFLWGSSNSTTSSSSTNTNKKKKKKEGAEPRSVLDHIRSPSPPSSTSTLSSNLPEPPTALAALSDANPSWPPPLQPPPSSEKREEWVPELQPISLDAPLLGASHHTKCIEDDWESMLGTTVVPHGPPSPHDHSFLKWIMSDIDDTKHQQPPQQQQQPPTILGDLEAAAVDGGGFGLPADSSGFVLEQMGGGGSSSSSNGKAPLLGGIFPGGGDAFLPPGNAAALFDTTEEKPQVFPSSSPLLQQPPQNPSFLLPFSPFSLLEQQSQQQQQQQLVLPPPAKRLLHSMPNPTTTPEIPQDHLLHTGETLGGGGLSIHHHAFPFPVPVLPQRAPPNKPDATHHLAHHHHHQQQQEIIDPLFRAAEMIGGGSFVSAQGILARLNHLLPSPVGKPLVRSAFYFKEALLNAAAAAASGNPNPTQPKTPLDVVLKISAYKSFSEISPVLQFTNFTCVQALLEELSGSDRIHLLDFDIGFGGQWSSFLQEISQRRPTSSSSPPSLRITAFVSPSSSSSSSSSSYHPLELALTRDNLTHFATDLGIPFEFNFLALDSFDPATFHHAASNNEAIAVSIPVGSSSSTTPGFLRLIKQLSPKVVVAVDHGCDRGELPFAQHMLNLLHSYTVLLESIDAAGASLDTTNKIERLLLQPRIEAAVLGRCRATDKTVPWRTMATSAGFVPVHFSNFTETQAECLLKRVQVRGFHAEKRQSSLVLFWQRGELVSVSAWRC